MNHRLRLTLGILCAVLLSGCGGGAETSSPPSELEGLITRVEGHGSEVRAFVVEAGGESFEILVISNVDYGFDLEHLREHEQTEEPVRVRVEEREGSL